MIRMVIINLFLAMMSIDKVDAAQVISFQPGPLTDLPVRESVSDDINKVIRSQIDTMLQKYGKSGRFHAAEYKPQKMTKGTFYDTLKRDATLKELKSNLKTDFRKVRAAASTGQKLPNNFVGIKSEIKHSSHETKPVKSSTVNSSKTTRGRSGKIRNPIPKTGQWYAKPLMQNLFRS